MTFLVTTGSVLGREHARLMKNNQDGVAARVEAGLAVAVVTDGCGSGAQSEVGARLGARFLAQRLPALVREFGVAPSLADRAADALVEWLGAVVRPLDVDGKTLPALVQEQWLFTVLCAVMDEKLALVFGIGDGGWSADGVGRRIDSGPDNAPDYLAYRLVPAEVTRTVAPAVHFWGEASQLLIATDGLTDLAIDEGALWKNPYALERKLRVRAGHDDATAAFIRRAA